MTCEINPAMCVTNSHITPSLRLREIPSLRLYTNINKKAIDTSVEGINKPMIFMPPVWELSRFAPVRLSICLSCVAHIS